MKMRKQRLWGLALVLISFAVIAFARTGTTPEEQDVTAILVTLPLGIYAMVTKYYILYDNEDGKVPADQPPKPTKKGATTWQENESPKPLPSRPGKTLTQHSVRSRRRS